MTNKQPGYVWDANDESAEREGRALRFIASVSRKSKPRRARERINSTRNALAGKVVKRPDAKKRQS